MELNRIQITGPSADIYWGYHHVATLRDWLVIGSAGAFTLTGKLVGSDDFWMSRRPLVVVTPNGWRWWMDPSTLQIANETLSASIRSQESPDVALSYCHT